jgi:hypothetical protein
MLQDIEEQCWRTPLQSLQLAKSMTLKNPIAMVATCKSTKQTLEQITDHNLFCPILTRNVQSHKMLAQLSHFALLEHATYDTHTIAINNLGTSIQRTSPNRKKQDRWPTKLGIWWLLIIMRWKGCRTLAKGKDVHFNLSLVQDLTPIIIYGDFTFERFRHSLCVWNTWQENGVPY